MQTPGEAPLPPVDARWGQGVAVGTHITQHNYFYNSAAAPGPRRRDVSRAAGDPALRVFISSTSGALAPYRQAAVEVCHRLGMTPVHMEDFDPERPAPEQVCQREVNGCDVFVLLLAHRYGDRPPGQQLSYTELEYRCAASRPGMPLLAFVVDPEYAWPPPEIDRGADAAALARFAASVRAEHTVRRLAELAIFREDLMLALSKQRSVPAPAEDAAAGPEEPGETRVPAPPEFHAQPPYVGGAPFTGRAEDLAALDEWARSAEPVMVVEAIGGTGKSALTWQWAQDRAPAAVAGLAGRMWWSFYEGSASMTRFLQELLAYTSGWPMKQVRRLERADLVDEALAALRRRPYLVVLDGFERLLAAYHRFDPSKLRDEEVEPNKRSLIEPQADDIVRRLAAAGPSKILISTRLMPIALQGRFGQRMPGVQHRRLPGLTDADTRALLARLDVYGSQPAIAGFFRSLGNHPLLVGIVAGLVRDYRAAPGDFDSWLADPTAGGALRPPDLDLTQRRTHILAAALEGLQPAHRRLLGWISVLAGTVNWATLEAINPFRPEPPVPIGPGHGAIDPISGRFGDEAAPPGWADRATPLLAQAGRQREEQLAAWRSSELVTRAKAQLDAALKDLEERGLLWWDRAANSYDLHPIIRAYAHDQLEDTDRVQANDRVRDHFQALPPEDPGRAGSVEDLTQTITIFRALIGAGRRPEASALWAQLQPALLVNLGAYATIIELLAPIENDSTSHGAYMRTFLGISYQNLGRYEEAVTLETNLLADALRSKGFENIGVRLGNLAISFSEMGAIATGSRCLDFVESFSAATGVAADGTQVLQRAELEAFQGQTEHAHELINQAEAFGPRPGTLWFEESIEYWRLYLALVADQSLTHAQLNDAVGQVHSVPMRRELAELRCKLFVRQEEPAQALTAAQEYEHLGRNAGLDVVPALSAFLLAKLGRAGEAAGALEESLARLPRIHPADRPHYRLAQTLRELGRGAEAAAQARDAYRQAWCDGPPYCRFWDLRDARTLLQAMGEPIPGLPTIDPATVTVPLEDEVRAVITTLETKRRNARY